MLLHLEAILLLLAFIGFIPGSLHDYAEDLCPRIFGQIDSHILWLRRPLFRVAGPNSIFGLIAIAMGRRRTGLVVLSGWWISCALLTCLACAVPDGINNLLLLDAAKAGATAWIAAVADFRSIET